MELTLPEKGWNGTHCPDRTTTVVSPWTPLLLLLSLGGQKTWHCLGGGGGGCKVP